MAVRQQAYTNLLSDCTTRLNLFDVSKTEGYLREAELAVNTVSVSPLRLGLVALLGSGETSPVGGQVLEAVAKRFAAPLNVAVLETPAGFEPNSARVAGRVAGYLQQRLQNHQPTISVIPARRRGTPFSPDDPALAKKLHMAQVIFLGPGSPTYAVRQLRGSRVWQTVLARHHLGAAVVLASAAAIAASAWVLPVYEIYKAGAKVHWQSGLDLLGPYGLQLAIVPHWNNTEGGTELDTTRCFIGQARFAELLDKLTPQVTVLGLDENTGLLLDLEAGQGYVMGRGQVSIIRAGERHYYGPGASMPLRALGEFGSSASPALLPDEVWAEAVAASAPAPVATAEPPPEVIQLVEVRRAARERRDWAVADALRRQMAGLGWQISDGPDGPHIQPIY